MNRLMSIAGLVAGIVAVGCSGPGREITQPPRSQLPTELWSDSVLTVDTLDANEHGELRGIVLDSASGTPVPGARVMLASEMSPAPPGHASSMAILNVGSVVTDAAGHFLVSSLPEGYFYLEASRQGELLASGGVAPFAFSQNASRDVTIYVGHSIQP